MKVSIDSSIICPSEAAEKLPQSGEWRVIVQCEGRGSGVAGVAGEGQDQGLSTVTSYTCKHNILAWPWTVNI